MILVTLKYFAIPYILIPSAGAAVAGWFVSDWRTAAAVLVGALIFVRVFPYLEPALLKYPLPVIVGAGIGCLALLPLLLARPGTARLARVAVATLVTATAGTWLVFSNPGIV